MSIANLNDMATLITDPTFGNRVLASVTIYASTTVQSEVTSSTLTASVHQARKNFASSILNNPIAYKPLFVNVVGCNQTVANDATASGTIVGQSGASLANSALLCTDTDINNAVASAFNALIPNI